MPALNASRETTYGPDAILALLVGIEPSGVGRPRVPRSKHAGVREGSGAIDPYHNG